MPIKATAVFRVVRLVAPVILELVRAGRKAREDDGDAVPGSPDQEPNQDALDLDVVREVARPILRRLLPELLDDDQELDRMVETVVVERQAIKAPELTSAIGALETGLLRASSTASEWVQVTITRAEVQAVLEALDETAQ